MADDDDKTDRVLMTIDITSEGDIVRWTGSKPNGDVLEDWKLTGLSNEARQSHTWELDGRGYLAVRDILRYITEEDWEPDTIM